MNVMNPEADRERMGQERDEVAAPPSEAASSPAIGPDPSRRSRVQLILRFVLGLAALLSVVVLLVRTLRPELEGVGT